MSNESYAEQTLDKTLADTFPASDPLSALPNPSFDSFSSGEPAKEKLLQDHTDERDPLQSEPRRKCA
jgi:hypothetical protein